MISAQDREMIRAYVSGQLDEASRQEVEDRLATDQEFRRELMAERELQKDRAAKTEDGPRYESRNRVEGSGPVQPEVAPRNTRWWLIAAGVALLAVIGYYVFQMQPGGSTKDDLFSSYFEPYSLSLYETAQEGQETFSDAIQAYRQGDYDEAVARFEASEPQLTTSPVNRFYLAVAQLATGEGEAAAGILQDVLTEETNIVLSEPAQWYLALAYLEAGEEEASRQRLREIAEKESHPMHDQASNLLRDMERS